MKKLLAVLLSLCLVVGMLPMMAFAEEGTDVPDPGASMVEEPKDDTSTTPGDSSKDIPPEPEEQEDTEGGNEDDIKEKYPGIEDYNGDNEIDDFDIGLYNGSYNPRSINYYKELLNFLEDEDATADVITLGLNITIPAGETVNINRNITINGNSKEIQGTGTLSIGENVTVTLNVNLTSNVSVAEGATLSVSGSSHYAPPSVNGNGKIMRGEEQIYPVPDEEEDDEGGTTKPDPDEGDEGDEEEPKLVIVTVNVDPAWATVTFTDANGKVYTVKNGKVELPTGTYDVAARAMGYGTYEEEITIKGETSFGITLSADPVRVIPSSHGYVKVNKPLATEGDIVRITVKPDSNYYLDDLTIKGVKSGDTYRFWRDKYESNVFYFKMPDENVTVDADFSAYPDEYRVYIASDIKHGDVSVDTRYAEEGDWVYITVDPDVGYRLYGLTVTRPSGNTVKVEHVRGNVFRFKMPGVRVTVDAEFIRTVTPFTDVHLSDWFYESVSYVYWNGLMEGVTSYEFAPNATTTRAMVVQILYRMAGSPRVTGGSPFGDVSAGAWYADAVIWAEANNIVNGVSATRFDPNAPVTREQLATMLYRYAQYRHYNTSAGANTNILSYYDANHISEYAFSALQWVCGEGIVDGTGNGYLSPQGQATRAQLAAMLMRFCTL